jgi:hypothetical protein
MTLSPPLCKRFGPGKVTLFTAPPTLPRHPPGSGPLSARIVPATLPGSSLSYSRAYAASPTSVKRDLPAALYAQSPLASHLFAKRNTSSANPFPSAIPDGREHPGLSPPATFSCVPLSLNDSQPCGRGLHSRYASEPLASLYCHHPGSQTNVLLLIGYPFSVRIRLVSTIPLLPSARGSAKVRPCFQKLAPRQWRTFDQFCMAPSL